MLAVINQTAQTQLALTDKEVMYLAGLYEGEGYFAYLKRKNRLLGEAVAVIEMVDEDVIAKVSLWLGKSYNVVYREKNKTTYKVKLSGKKAIWLMTALYPYMGIRRATKIEEVTREYYGDRP